MQVPFFDVFSILTWFFPLNQLGTLGAGNHYAEIQVVEEIYNDYAAKRMGIDHKGQVDHCSDYCDRVIFKSILVSRINSIESFPIDFTFLD